jgi:Tol biopolymer transport system component
MRADLEVRVRAREALVLLLFLPVALSAQSFGRNKVTYKVIDFSVLTTDHFQIFHYPKEAPPVVDAAHLLEKWYARHAELLGFNLGGPQKVILYDSFADFQQANAVPGLISAGEGGVTESLGGRILIPLTGIPSDDDHVLGHELVHAFQFQAMKASSGLPSAAPRSLPTWFIEGMAEYLSLGPDDPLTAMWMRDALLHGDVPSTDDMASRPDRYFPYRFGQAVWAFIDRRWGHPLMRDFFDEAVRHGVQSAMIAKLHVMTTADFAAQWKEDLMTVHGPALADRTPPGEVGRTLAAFGGRTNLGPAMSPDGRFIAVFSQVDPFSFSLTLVDSASGRALRTLGSTGTDAHFDSLHFINATGGWSADSRHFAFPVQRDGRDAVAIAGIPGGRIERVVELPQISDVSGITWSPRADQIALAGTVDAVSGLWLLDLATESLKRLTHGRAAYVQPAWSPDGTTLAFVTDYGPRTDRTARVYGSMNIGLMDIQTGEIRIISIRDGAVHVDPQYSPDGRSIYFVADPDGVPDVYRYSLDTGKFSRITRVATGVSGLTRLSPCLSVSRGTGELAFTVFNKRDYEIHILPQQSSPGTETSFEGAIPLPSLIDEAGLVAPAPAGAVTAYRPTFSLLSASAANVGITVDSFGAAIGGSAELIFQDVLGDHLIDAAAQVNGTVDTLGGRLFYLNTRRRFAWGIGAAHLPQTVYSLLPPSQFTVSGADTGIVQQLQFTELAELQGAYSFSANRRLEADLSYSHIWWEPTSPVYYFKNGVQIGQDQLSIAQPAPLDLVHAGMAYVGDYSFSGFTEPLKGYRYRFELGGDGGSLFFLTLAADVRAYLFLKPIGLAVRGLHVGRYLGDADNPVLANSFLGDPGLVRGYEYYSMVTHEGAGGANVPQIDRLFGSRIAVIKAEVRLPLLGNGDIGLFVFPYLPITLVGFFDAGMAWTGSVLPELAWSTDPSARIPVFSAGGAIRFNLFGVAVLEIYFAWPFQRPGVNGSWGFLVEEGW